MALSIESLTKVSNGAKSTVTGMQKVIEALNAKIEQFESDKSRSQNFIAEQIKAEREKILPALGANLTLIREATAVAEAQREFWSSRALLMSRQRFSDDDTVNELTRLRLAGELAVMDLPLLTLTMKNAMADGSLALVWSCIVAGRNAAAGSLPDWSGIAIPQQAQALALIDSCDASLAEAEMIVAGASGLSMDPVRKLTFAHRMNPNAPTKHNSAGRAAA